MKDYYVYRHYRPSNGETFYIGKGTKGRVLNGQNSRSEAWQQVAMEESGFLFEILKDNLNESEAYELERLTIETIGWENLVNMDPADYGNRKKRIHYKLTSPLGDVFYASGTRDASKQTGLSRNTIIYNRNKGPLAYKEDRKIAGWVIDTISFDDYERLKRRGNPRKAYRRHSKRKAGTG